MILPMCLTFPHQTLMTAVSDLDDTWPKPDECEQK